MIDMKRLLTLLLVLLCFFSNFPQIHAQLNSDNFTLTEEELNYLNTLKDETLILAVTSEMTSFKDINNEQAGMLEPLIKLLNQWGIQVETILPTWEESFNLLDNEEVDLLGLAGSNREREEKYFSTTSLNRAYMEIFTRNDARLDELINLNHAKIGLTTNSTLSNRIDEYLYPHGEVVYYESFDEMFTALENNEIDCVISALNVFGELIKHPSINYEMRIESVIIEQVMFAKKEKLKPLIEIINRYLSSANGNDLLNTITNDKDDNIFKLATKHFAYQIKDVQKHEGDYYFYDSLILYPLCYKENGEIKGRQVEINKVFYELTGKNIQFLDLDSNPMGLNNAMEMIENGDLDGASGIYFNSDYMKNEKISLSSVIMTDNVYLYKNRNDEIDQFNMQVETTQLFKDKYVNWKTFTGHEVLICNNRSELLEDVKTNEVDAIFVSEMAVDYNYMILKDYSLVQFGTLTIPAKIHIIYNVKNESFNELMNLSIMLQKLIYPESNLSVSLQSRSNKYELMQVQNKVEQSQQSILQIIGMFSVLLVILLLVLQK